MERSSFIRLPIFCVIDTSDYESNDDFKTTDYKSRFSKGEQRIAESDKGQITKSLADRSARLFKVTNGPPARAGGSPFIQRQPSLSAVLSFRV